MPCHEFIPVLDDNAIIYQALEFLAIGNVSIVFYSAYNVTIFNPSGIDTTLLP